MSILPRMPAAEPVIVPASAGGEYPDWFNTLLLARPLANGGQGTCTLKFRPYNYETGELLSDPARELTITRDDFWAYALARPALAQAIGYLTQALGLASREAELEGLLAAAPESPDAAAWQAALAAVRTDLGMTEQ